MLDIYIDGSCINAGKNGGSGGWAVYCKDDSFITHSGFKYYTTSQEMELKALLEAFAKLKPGTNAVIYTDSEYASGAAGSWRLKVHFDMQRQIQRYMAALNQTGHVEVKWEARSSSNGNKQANAAAQLQSRNADLRAKGHTVFEEPYEQSNVPVRDDAGRASISYDAER